MVKHEGRGRRTFPVGLRGTDHLEHVDAPSAMGGLQDHGWVDAEFIAHAMIPLLAKLE